MVSWRIALAVALQTAAASVCAAQSSTPFKLDFDTDVRASSVVGSRSLSGDYRGTLALDGGLGRGWNMEVYAHLGDRLIGSGPALGDVVFQQASVEKEWSSQRLEVGLVRLPFGIYDYRETYASGIIDYPLARTDYGYSSVDWGVPGAKWTGGSPNLQIEAAAFAGRSSGVWGNVNDAGGAALRLQTYRKGIILGASHWEGYLHLPAEPYNSYGPAYTPEGGPRSAVSISGLDVRFTRPHLLIRGELLAGTLDGQQMNGWYLDIYYHLPKYQQFTFVARAEAMRPDSDEPIGRQITFGVRYTAARDWTLAVNWRRNNFDHAYSNSWTSFSGTSGMVYFQYLPQVQSVSGREDGAVPSSLANSFAVSASSAI